MAENSGALVFWILVPLFVAVGIYLLWYSRRRKKMLEAFASSHQLRIRPELQEELQKKLGCFSLNREHLVRSFGQLSSIVDGDKVWLFRAVELLDLNPHALSYSTNFVRIIALFDVSTEHEEFFLLDKSLQAVHRLKGSEAPNKDVVTITRKIVMSVKSRHPLSVTLTHDQGLIYFEPLVTGGEKLDDVDALYRIAKKMAEELAGTTELISKSS